MTLSPSFHRFTPAPSATTSPAISSPGMSVAPAGGGYRPWRCITSGRLTPAAATFTSTSPSPGRGSGRCSGTSISAPPGARIAIAVIWAGNEGMAKSLADAAYGVSLSRGGRCDNGAVGGYFSPALERRRAMPAMDDDDRPKKKIVHEIGQDLALLSIKELQERIALLNEEIARLQATIASKQGSRNVADQYFKK